MTTNSSRNLNIRFTSEEIELITSFQKALQEAYPSVRITQRTVIVQALKKLADSLEIDRLSLSPGNNSTESVGDLIAE
jgi:hypothetical protein